MDQDIWSNSTSAEIIITELNDSLSLKHVDCYTAIGASCTNVISIEVKFNNSIVLHGLIAGESYSIGVILENETGEIYYKQAHVCTVPRGVDLSYISIKQQSDVVYLGASTQSDIKSVDGKIDGFRIKSITPVASVMFPAGLDNASADGAIAVKFPPADIFRIQVASYIEGCENVESYEIATFEYCSGPEPVLNLQQIPSDEFAILLSWDEPADTRRIRPDGYEITITTLSGKTLISTWLLASTQNNQTAYTFDSSSIKSLPVATEFICSVRTSIPNPCQSKDEFQEVFYDFNVSTRNISCKTRGFGGKAQEPSFTFFSPTLIILQWKTPDDFLNQFEDDYYSILLNGKEKHSVAPIST
ncbi:uncharacterized protein LOC134856343, partial [Symsagittifera roscoffensis]|uniref:uncharacterized protein LOC134856343 n=1 Tax=Symsagittifera roscoffensis TaxID=84072 RepID=UPI00307B309A